MCPTFAAGMSFNKPPTIPRPALKIGTTAGFLPAITGQDAFSIGVSISIFSSSKPRNASYHISIEISSTMVLNSLVPVSDLRSIVILCLIRGWSQMITFSFPLYMCKNSFRMLVLNTIVSLILYFFKRY